MLQQMLQFYSDAYYKAPHDHLVNGLIRNNVPTYIYRYAYATSDPFNNVLNTTGFLDYILVLECVPKGHYLQELLMVLNCCTCLDRLFSGKRLEWDSADRTKL